MASLRCSAQDLCGSDTLHTLLQNQLSFDSGTNCGLETESVTVKEITAKTKQGRQQGRLSASRPCTMLQFASFVSGWGGGRPASSTTTTTTRRPQFDGLKTPTTTVVPQFHTDSGKVKLPFMGVSLLPTSKPAVRSVGFPQGATLDPDNRSKYIRGLVPSFLSTTRKKRYCYVFLLFLAVPRAKTRDQGKPAAFKTADM